MIVGPLWEVTPGPGEELFNEESTGEDFNHDGQSGFIIRPNGFYTILHGSFNETEVGVTGKDKRSEFWPGQYVYIPEQNLAEKDRLWKIVRAKVRPMPPTDMYEFDLELKRVDRP